MPLTGDLTVFPRLRALLGRMVDVPKATAKKLAPKLDRRLQACFDTATNPYGKPWPKLAPSTIVRKGGDARILMRTDQSRQLTYVAALGKGVAISVGKVLYWHLRATRYRPERAVLPTHGLPATWKEDARAAGGEAFAQALGGRF